jgi:hypothetical protein
MISRCKKIGYTALQGNSIDEPNKAHIPLSGIPSVDHCIPALEHETNRVGSISKRSDRADHRVDNKGMFILEVRAVPPPSRIAISQGRELRNPSALLLRRERDEGCFNRYNFRLLLPFGGRDYLGVR